MSYRFAWPPVEKFIKVWLGIYIGFFLFNTLAQSMGLFSAVGVWGLSFGQISQFKIWTLATYWLLSFDLFEILFNGLLFWFLGGELYNTWGQKKFLSVMAVCIFGGALFYILLDFAFGPLPHLHGSHGLSTALILIYGMMYPDRELYLLFFPVKGRYFCLILLAMEVYRFLFSPSKLNYLGHLVGAALGILYWWVFINNKPLFRFGARKGGLFKRSQRKKLTLVKDQDTPPKYWQ